MDKLFLCALDFGMKMQGFEMPLTEKSVIMSDFWIGDWIKIVSSGKIGKFEGEFNKKAKIRFDNKVLLCDLFDIQLLAEEEIPKSKYILKRNKPRSESHKKYSNIIDLHIEKLSPQMQYERAELIISFQIKKAKEFILESIKRKQLSITIIHGKGVGALKKEIEAMLTSFDEVYFTKSINNGGAVEIQFQYH